MKNFTWLALAAGMIGTAQADPSVIYGTITTNDGRELSGVLSWDGEENYWIQQFNGRARDPVDLTGLDADTRKAILDRQPGPQLEIGDLTVELVKWFSDPELRPTDFAVEFGAIEVMDFDRGAVTVTLRGGGQLASRGGSNDIGADIQVLSADGSERELDWDDLERIRFSEAPSAHPTFPPQLFGTALTAHGELRGLVAWDSDERIATEMLDGEIDGEEVSLEFGNIRSIEPRGEAALVVAGDGRELLLEGSNDVNSENRGLILVGPAHGRIDVVWEELERLTLEPIPEGYLPSRRLWEGAGPLTGQVSSGGELLTGALFYDVDEQYQVQTLDGYVGDSELWIPFRLVSEVVRGNDESTVTLRGGLTWTVARDRDVASTNNGVVVDVGSERRYLLWEAVERVRFDPPRVPSGDDTGG